MIFFLPLLFISLVLFIWASIPIIALAPAFACGHAVAALFLLPFVSVFRKKIGLAVSLSFSRESLRLAGLFQRSFRLPQ